MKKLLLLLASAAVASLLPVAASAAGPGKPTVVLQFLDVSTSFTSTSGGNTERFGDQFAFHDDIYRWNGTKRGALIGHADITATIIAPNMSRLSAVAHLPGGTLVVFGDNVNSARTQVLPVIGGTGIYATARGELIARNIGGENSNNTAITIRLWM